MMRSCRDIQVTVRGSAQDFRKAGHVITSHELQPTEHLRDSSENTKTYGRNSAMIQNDNRRGLKAGEVSSCSGVALCSPLPFSLFHGSIQPPSVSVHHWKFAPQMHPFRSIFRAHQCAGMARATLIRTALVAYDPVHDLGLGQEPLQAIQIAEF